MRKFLIQIHIFLENSNLLKQEVNLSSYSKLYIYWFLNSLQKKTKFPDLIHLNFIIKFPINSYLFDAKSVLTLHNFQN